jgi:hypothetical protein
MVQLLGRTALGNLKRIALALVVYVSCGTSIARCVVQHSESDVSRSFCADRDNPALVALPNPVVQAIMATESGREASAFAEQSGTRLATSRLFRGWKVNISASKDNFYIVIGSYPMSGADNDWFWVVRQSKGKATVLLWAGANCLDVMKGVTRGFKNIEAAWSSPSSTRINRYVFDGRRYKLQSSRSWENKR